MAINSPLVSVVMTTYNHEKYIAEAIDSVLNQTFTNFELIIINDGSSDRTDEIIKSFLHDQRIVYIHQDNQGTSIAINNGILTAKGKYIALFSGDDICDHQRLEKQYSFISSSNFKYKIVFSGFDVIDDHGNILVDNFLNNWFIQQHKSRTEIVNLFFFKGNCLNAITAFLEKQLILDIGLFNLTS
ncbi:glycosyltransferase family 2 protein, partial [Nostoc sp.]|uniref:glycosyltransferase family 2 protein n=1 Tax=Nostoc sp. TaxID=1180 RepID=UPI002FF83C28